MKVSVITVARNSARTIRDALDSVRAQTLADIEHLLVDAQSTDGTLDIARSYPHITHLISEPDDGLYDAINKGIRLAQGDVVGILNSDDIYADANVLSELVRVFESRSCDAVYGDLVYVASGDVNRVLRYWRAGDYTPGAFKWGWMPPHPTFFLKRECYERYGVYNPLLGTAADYELMLRMIHMRRISTAYVPDVLVRMRIGGASNRTWAGRMAANRNDRRAWSVNGLSPYWFTVYLKPLRKITQFMARPPLCLEQR